MEVVHMGLNTTKGDPNWDALVKQFKEIVERDGECRASWSCTGRTRHVWQSEVLAKELEAEGYVWEIDYDSYLCIARKVRVGDKVRIEGDYTDMTDHRHYQVGEVVTVREKDYVVKFDTEYLAVWPYRILEVIR